MEAIAGATGSPTARIFCSDFAAEMVAIGGFYNTDTDFDPALRGKPVQVRLVEDRLETSIL